MGDFRLGGHALVTTCGRDALAELRKGYLTRASELRAAFCDDFDSVNSVEELFARFQGSLDRAFDRTVVAVAKDIAQERIYHWDAATLRRELADRSKALRQDFDRICARYQTITVRAEEREVIRAAGGENRPSIIDGGVGEGAAKGSAIAPAANAVMGAVRGAASAVAKAAASLSDRQKKKELLGAPQTRLVFVNLIHDIALEGHRLVADIVNRESAEPKFDVISIDARRRASALAENVEAGHVPETEIARVLIEALQLDPFAEKPWRLWLKHLGDYDGGVGRAAEALGFADVASHKNYLLDRKRAALAWSTPEECRSNVVQLHETARFLGLPFDEERRRIEGRAEVLDRERRTFMGTVYNTVEEVNDARLEAADVARRTVGGVVHASLEEAEADRATRADEKRRTFRKIIYQTHAAAEAYRQRYYRSTSISIWLAILAAPIPAAIFTLMPGFRLWQRLIVVVWLILWVAIVYSRAAPDGHLVLSCIFLTGAAFGFMSIEVRIRTKLFELSAAGDSARVSDFHQTPFERRWANLAALAAKVAKMRPQAQAATFIRLMAGHSVKRVLSNWKTCEYCTSTVKSAATVCRYCYRDLA